METATKVTKIAANVGVVLMCATWLGFVAYTVVRDRKQKPVDILISAAPMPMEP